MGAVLQPPKPYAIFCQRPGDARVEVIFSRHSCLVDAIKAARQLRANGMPCAVRRVVANGPT
jgi:hypothetical protein